MFVFHQCRSQTKLVIETNNLLLSNFVVYVLSMCFLFSTFLGIDNGVLEAYEVESHPRPNRGLVIS